MDGTSSPTSHRKHSSQSPPDSKDSSGSGDEGEGSDGMSSSGSLEVSEAAHQIASAMCAAQQLPGEPPQQVSGVSWGGGMVAVLAPGQPGNAMHSRQHCHSAAHKAWQSWFLASHPPCCAPRPLSTAPPTVQLLELASLLHAYGLVSAMPAFNGPVAGASPAASSAPPPPPLSPDSRRQQQRLRQKSAPKLNGDGSVRLNARQRRTLRRAQERAMKALLEAQTRTHGITSEQVGACVGVWFVLVLVLSLRCWPWAYYWWGEWGWRWFVEALGCVLCVASAAGWQQH